MGKGGKKSDFVLIYFSNMEMWNACTIYKRSMFGVGFSGNTSTAQIKSRVNKGKVEV